MADLPVDSPSVTEIYDTIEQKTPGGKWVAPLAATLAGLAIIVFSGRYLLENVVSPLGAWLATQGGAVAQWNALAGIGVAAFLFICVAEWRLSRRVKTLETLAHNFAVVGD